MLEAVSAEIQASLETCQKLLKSQELLGDISDIVKLCLAAYREGGKIIVAGNGGSAADAQHFAGELVSRFYFDRPALAAVALTTDTSILTAIGNDYGYEKVFSRQVEANGNPGDIFFALSTSGNSPNILEAIEVARSKRLKVIGLTGASGGKMAPLCDICLQVPSSVTPRIQECHIMVIHTICGQIEKSLFKANP